MSLKLVVETVVDVYTVEQLKEKALQSDGKLEPLHGIIYGYISTLDIDENVSKVLRNRWWATACLEFVLKTVCPSSPDPHEMEQYFSPVPEKK